MVWCLVLETEPCRGSEDGVLARISRGNRVEDIPGQPDRPCDLVGILGILLQQGIHIPKHMCNIKMTWDRLIRFHPSSAPDTVLYGEPVASDMSDIGQLVDRGELSARVLDVGSEGPLAEDVKVTERTEKVDKLLSPLSWTDCPGIKCIGLNYKKHSETIRISSSNDRADGQFRKAVGHHPLTLPSSSSHLPAWRAMVKPSRCQRSHKKERQTTRLNSALSSAKMPRTSRATKPCSTSLASQSGTM